MVKVDTTATTGLRGLAALHIMVRLSLPVPDVTITDFVWLLDIPLRRYAHIRRRGSQWGSRSANILPSLWILSDFEIREVTLRHYSDQHFTFVPSSEQTHERSWSSVQFLKRRLSRILPLYYIANFLGYFGRSDVRLIRVLIITRLAFNVDF